MKFVFLFSFFLLPAAGFSQTSLDQLFGDCGVEGSITLYHLESGTWIFSDSTDARVETLPASTFKILNSAIAVETGVISETNEMLEWDGTEHTFFGLPVESWNRNTDMESAFKNSAIWFYEEMAKRIEKENYRHWLQSVGYGNGNLTEPGDDFWNYGNFGVSPVNQIRFLEKLYSGKTPFSKNTVQTVQEMMLSESTDSYTISGKTGWTKTDIYDIGWWVGYLEKEDQTWFFATRIFKDLNYDHPGFSTCRLSVTKKALSELEILP